MPRLSLHDFLVNCQVAGCTPSVLRTARELCEGLSKVFDVLQCSFHLALSFSSLFTLYPVASERQRLSPCMPLSQPWHQDITVSFLVSSWSVSSSPSPLFSSVAIISSYEILLPAP